MPRVSIIMPAYNAAPTIKESIDSILSQTYGDFEFIIIDDGSEDGTVRIIQSYSDERIRLFQNQENQDLVFTLNKGIEFARGEYIVRMDADDIALPYRVEKQVTFMDEHPLVGVCGTWIKLFGGANDEYHNPTDYEEIKSTLFFRNAIAHPSVIMRKSMLDEYNLRYEKHLAEDYDLWLRASFCFQLCNMPEVLLKYRISGSSYSQTNTKKVWDVLDDLIASNLKRLRIAVSHEDIQLQKRVGLQMPLVSQAELFRLLPIWVKIALQNQTIGLYDSVIFNRQLWGSWVLACEQTPITWKVRLKLCILFMIRGRIFTRYAIKYVVNLIISKLRKNA